MRLSRRGGVVLAVSLLAVLAVVALAVVARRGPGGPGEVSSSTSWPTLSTGGPFPTVPNRGTAPPAKSEPGDTGASTTAPTAPSTTARAAVQFPSAADTGPLPTAEGLAPVDVPASPYWRLDHDLDGVTFTGMIVIAKAGITIRNSRIVATESVAGIWNPDQLPGLVIDHVQVVCTAVPPTGSAIAGSNMVVRRSDISGCADGIKAGPQSTIVENYIHDLGFGDGTHNDGVQIGDGDDLEIRGNSIVQVDNGKRQANAAVFVQDTFAAVDRVSIVDNYVDGFGFTLRLSGARVTNANVAGNVIGTDHLFGAVLFDGGAEAVANGNRSTGNLRPDGTPID